MGAGEAGSISCVSPIPQSWSRLEGQLTASHTEIRRLLEPSVELAMPLTANRPMTDQARD